MADKFENIKVGDKVLVEEVVSYAFMQKYTFYIEKEVTRITKTQFVVEGDRRFNKNGTEIGGSSYYSRAYQEGEKPNSIVKEGLKDQTKEMNEFKEKLVLSRKITDLKDQIKPTLGHTNEQLKVIVEKLTEIIQMEVPQE